jgi:hypothetical protein
MHSKISLAALALAAAMLTMPVSAQAHWDRVDKEITRMGDCLFGWMRRDEGKKVYKARAHRHHAKKAAPLK